jgi:sec1 family domain-containing protein 1
LTNEYVVLLILDRNVDLVSVLSHGWTYQALVSDCLEIKLNRVVVTQQQQPKRSYDLDSKDFFWARNAANPFPQVAEEIDTELNKYKQDAAEITRSTGVSDVNDISQLWDLSFIHSDSMLTIIISPVTYRRMLRI